MTNYISTISKTLLTYWETNAIYQWLFYAGLIVIFFKSKETHGKHALFWYPMLCYIFLISPIFYIIGRFLWDDNPTQYLCRQFSVVPIFYCIAYAGVLLIKKYSGAKKLTGVLLISFLLCVLGSGLIYKIDGYAFVKSENPYKLSTDMMKICDYMDSVDADGVPRVVTDYNLSYQIRQYDASVIDLTGYQDATHLSRSLEADTPNVAGIMELCCAEGADFVIIKNTESVRNDFAAIGHTPCFETSSYLLYECYGYEGYRITYEKHNQIVRIDYYYADGSPRLSEHGYATITYIRDIDGNPIEEHYYGEDGAPIAVDGAYGLKCVYDGPGNRLERNELDENGNVVEE